MSSKRKRVLLRGMIIDAAGERSRQGRFLSKSAFQIRPLSERSDVDPRSR